MRAPRIIKEVYANVYDSKFDDDKGSKEKEEQKSSSKDSKENKQKFFPSLTSPKEDKTRNFAPKLAETDKKDGSFKPTLSDSKEAKNDAFKPKLNPEPKNSEKSFTPSLEMPEKRERGFNPKLNESNKPLNPKSTKKLSINEMQKIAQERGGKCLSTKYVNAITKLKWQCSEGHEWNAVPNNVKNRGSWCPECANTRVRNLNFKYNLNDMQKMAMERGGECVSKNYQGVKENLRWKCSQGHEWPATPDNVFNKNSWCPKCSDGTAERTCRQFFEKLFDKKFNKSYPKWLKSPAGNTMHLDGHSKELNIAFEYQGSQHSKFTPYFHKTMERFVRDQQYDKTKEELCKEQKVNLIKVPFTVKIEDMEKYIRDQVKQLGIKAPMNPDKIDYKSFKFNTVNKLVQMQKLAESRGGKLLSKKYINALTNLEWQCENGHVWKASPNNIKNNANGKDGTKGNWCPECAQRKKYTIDEVKRFARTKGGECLSTHYERSQGKLNWRCKNGHEFNTSFYSVKNQNTWCPECKKDQYLQKYKDLAKERGGYCLSSNYINSYTEMNWKCENGHMWSAIPNSIKQGSWCPECAGQKKYTIDDMKLLAKSYGGQCLSEKYLGSRENLEWRCKNGHEWSATPNHIKNNEYWCKECEKE